MGGCAWVISKAVTFYIRDLNIYGFWCPEGWGVVRWVLESFPHIYQGTTVQ